MSRKEELICLRDQAKKIGLDVSLLDSRIDELGIFWKRVNEIIPQAFELDLTKYRKKKYTFAIPQEKY
jgi:hypothetical protein